MTSRSATRAHLARSVITIESTIPPDMTILQWRRLLAVRQGAERQRRMTGLARRWKVARSWPRAEVDGSCTHFHETTTRYDHERKLLTFLEVCRSCGIEKVVETQHYEPRYEPAQPHGMSADTTAVGPTGRSRPV